MEPSSGSTRKGHVKHHKYVPGRFILSLNTNTTLYDTVKKPL